MNPISPFQILLGTLCLSLLASAMPVGAETLTLERALQLAERYSPRLQIAAAEVDRAISGISTARTFPNPELEVFSGGVRGRVPGTTSGQGTSLSIGQPIDLPMQRAPRIRAAEAGFESSRFALLEARLLVRADVQQAFYSVLRRHAEFGAFRNEQSGLVVGIDHGGELNHARILPVLRCTNNQQLRTHD